MRRWYVLLSVLLLAFVLRILTLGSMQLGVDELTTIRLGHEILGPAFFSLLLDEGHPFVYYSFISLLFTLVDSVFFARFVTVLLSLFSIFMTYLLAKKLFSSRVALLSSLLVATSAFHVAYSQHLRSYMFISCLFLVSTYFLLCHIVDRKDKRVHWNVVLYVLAFFSHYLTAFFIAAHALVLLVFGRLRKVSYALLYGPVVAGVLGFFWLPFFLRQVSDKVTAPLAFPDFSVSTFFHPFLKFALLENVSHLPSLLFLLFPLILLVFFALGVWRSYLFEKGSFLFLLLGFFCVFIISALVSFGFNVYYFRYFSYLAPVFFILVARGLDSENSVVLGTLVGLLVLVQLYFVYRYLDVSLLFDWGQYIAL